jgi:putative hydroxymethylpyrimidine transport system substrate-binding protein
MVGALRKVCLVGGLIFALLGAFILAGCGSSGSSSSGSTSSGGSTEGSGGSSEGGSGGESSKSLTPVNLVLEFAISPSQEGTFSAINRGFFEKQGIEVKYQVPGEVSVPVQAVATGKADFGLVLSTLSVSAFAEGAPIQVISTIEPHMGIGMMVLPEKIHSFTELKGKTVGNAYLPQEQICFNRQLQKYGISPSEVTQVNPGYNLVSTLLEGKVSAVVGSINYESQIVKAISGKEGHVFQFTEVCPSYNIQLITSKKMTEENPELVKKFVKAELEGTAWVAHHPEEAAEEFVKQFPEQEYEQIKLQSIATAPTYCAPYSETKGIGYNDPTYWTELIEMTASEPEVVETHTFPEKELVTNEFLPEPPMTEACANEFYKTQTGTQPIQ